ncbi:MAG: UMP kinase [Spirochaetaceae bacterium]|jgi:uridylate kinase|nr:UMP kinase [Spirochaetaceae bacterium]
MVTVVSLGGSIVAPNEPDVDFLTAFNGMVRQILEEEPSRKLILVVGGGAPARIYQGAYKKIIGDEPVSSEADWLGIMATRLNAQLLRAVFTGLCKLDVVYDPTKVTEFPGRIMVAAGWKPGFSTDNDAVLLAERFAAKTVINLSNIDKVYTGDPKVDPAATPLDAIGWDDFRKIVGDQWVPGKNTPFDPVASRHAQKAGITVLCVGGANLDNIRAALTGQPFFGTKIG